MRSLQAGETAGASGKRSGFFSTFSKVASRREPLQARQARTHAGRHAGGGWSEGVRERAGGVQEGGERGGMRHAGMATGSHPPAPHALARCPIQPHLKGVVP